MPMYVFQYVVLERVLIPRISKKKKKIEEYGGPSSAVNTTATDCKCRESPTGKAINKRQRI
jgi:hypothetical protein